MNGTQSSFQSIVAEHQSTVLRVCRSILHDEHLGADAAQETFLRLWQRLDRATELSDKLDSNRWELDFYRGLLIWQDSERYPANLWEITRQLQQLQGLAVESSDSIARLRETIAQRSDVSYAHDIAQLGQRLAAQRGQVELALAASGEQVRKTAVLELQQHARALSRSLGQSKLAIARLHDLGSKVAAP